MMRSFSFRGARKSFLQNMVASVVGLEGDADMDGRQVVPEAATGTAPWLQKGRAVLLSWRWPV